MKTRHFVLLVALGGIVLGCKTDPNQVLMEREHRELEDKIYQLQDCVQEKQQALESCRRENAALRQKAGLATAAPAASGAPPVAPGATVQPPPEIELPGAGTPQIPGSLERSGVAPPSGEAAPTFKTPPPSDIAPPFVPGGGSSLEPGAMPPSKPEAAPRFDLHSQSPLPPKVDSDYVERIALNPIITGPYDADGMPWEQGLSALVETRNVRGQLVRSAAPISVVVLDPALHGDAARVARWDFSAAEVAGMFRATSAAQGVFLQMRWPAGPPKHSALEVYVRFAAADGRKLETHRPISLDRGSRPQRQWTVSASSPGHAALPHASGCDGWQQLAEPAIRPAPAPLAGVPQPELRAAETSKADAKPAEPNMERPAWSPYR